MTGRTAQALPRLSVAMARGTEGSMSARETVGFQCESIGWLRCDEQMPDDGTTVMLFNDDWDEPVWLGWHDDEGWYEVSAAPLALPPTHWADMPEGPQVPA